MTPVLKSYGISLLLHASLVAALYAIPTPATRPFSQTGQTQVISIEAVQERAASTSLAYFEPQAMLRTSELDWLIDPVVKPESMDRHRLAESRGELEQRNEPQPPLPASVPTPWDDHHAILKRRQVESVMPEVTSKAAPLRRPKMPPPVAEPPAVTAIPLEQFVGIEKETSADLSNNRPPVYPREALRQRLEGAVLLQLRITAAGKVQEVKILKSSGHPILDQAAIDAVALWRGQPAKRWGRPIESLERLPIRFRL